MSQGFYESLLTHSPTDPRGRAPRSSAAVVPWRRVDGGEIEVYWVQRSPKLRFMGGWHAFPGGGLARGDAGLLSERPRGISASSFSAPDAGEERDRLGPDLVPGLAACAVRELFEEIGLLLLDESPVEPDRERLRTIRRRLEAGADFEELAAANRWQLSASRLVFAGRWLTPPVAPLRFDNRFFLLEWPRDRPLQPEILADGELAAGEWISPSRALERWRAGATILTPPILYILGVLAEDGPDRGLPRLRDPRETYLGPFRRIEFRPGVILLPLLTTTLPPATHTKRLPPRSPGSGVDRSGDSASVLRQQFVGKSAPGFRGFRSRSWSR